MIMTTRRKKSLQGNRGVGVMEDFESLRIEAINVCLVKLGMKPVDHAPLPPPDPLWRDKLPVRNREAREKMLNVFEGEPHRYVDQDHVLTSEERLLLSAVLRGGKCAPHALAHLKCVYAFSMLVWALKQPQTAVGRDNLQQIKEDELLAA